MKPVWIIVGIIVLVIIIIVFGGIGSYNGLVSSSQQVDQQWAQVQNVYQRRADLIPNLVHTVAGSANFEKSTMIAVTKARASVGQVQINSNSAPTSAAKLQAYEQAQGNLSSALSRLLVVAENYPDLKSSQNFLDLQAQLEGTENRIAFERGKFNKAVKDYNTRVIRFPTNIFANMYGFAVKPYFTAAQAAQTAPNVQFNFSTTAP